MAVGVEDVFFFGGGEAIEEGTALRGLDEDVASGGEHQGRHMNAGGGLLRGLHEVVEAGEEADGEPADAMWDVVEVGHIFVVGGEPGDAGFAVDEAHGGDFQARHPGACLAHEGDGPTGHGGAGFGHGGGEHEALRAQGAVGHGVDGDEGAHAFADEVVGCVRQMGGDEGGEVGAPFLRVEEMSAAEVIGVVALAAQVERPDSVAFGGQAAGQRTEVGRRAAQAVEANDVASW